jgi:hypothetical protein
MALRWLKSKLLLESGKFVVYVAVPIVLTIGITLPAIREQGDLCSFGLCLHAEVGPGWSRSVLAPL